METGKEERHGRERTLDGKSKGENCSIRPRKNRKPKTTPIDLCSFETEYQGHKGKKTLWPIEKEARKLGKNKNAGGTRGNQKRNKNGGDVRNGEWCQGGD